MLSSRVVTAARRAPLALCGPLFALLLALPVRHAPAGLQAPGLPADVQALIERARPLLASGDAAGLRALGVNPQALAWLSARPGEGRGGPEWKLDAMPVPAAPGAPPAWLAVFHSWHTVQSIGDHVHRVERTPEGMRFGREVPEANTGGFRIRDHDLRVSFDLGAGACTLTDTLKVERTGSVAGPCLLRLSADMTVNRLTVDGEAVAWRAVPGLIAIEAPSGRTFRVTLAYHGTVRHRFSDYIRPNEVVLLSYWYPHIGRLPSRSTITATVPQGWTAVAGGELTRRAEQNGQVAYTYRNEVPTCFFTLDAAQYHITTRQVGARTIRACFARQNDAVAERSLDEIAQALPVFERCMGRYPYTTFTVVQSNGPIGGAMEAYSFATFDPGSLPWAAAHELAHTWWGGLVPNPYTRSMWTEAFASYTESLPRRMASGRPPRAVQGLRAGGQGASPGSYPVALANAFDTSDGQHGAAGYGKGAIVLGMLEDLLGTETMMRCLRRFVADHRVGEAADWPEVRRAFEKETGKDLGWYFAQWVDRPGVPRLRLSGVRVTGSGAAWQVTGSVTQVGAPYRLRLPIRVGTITGGKVHAVVVDGRATHFTLAAEVKPTRVVIDPGGTVLLAGEGEGTPLEWRAP